MAPRAVPGSRLWVVPSPPRDGAPATPVPPLDDSELLAAMRSSRKSAARAFHDRVRPQVDRTIRRLLGPGDPEHEDVAQQAMMELVTTIHRYRGDCSLESWTSVVTAHVVYKHIRRRRFERRVFCALDAQRTAQVPGPVDVGREALARSAMQRVRGHLEAMGHDKAWTFVLHDVCGYDLREVARITNVSMSAAQTRLVRGRRELHERIGGDLELAQRLEAVEGHP
ncbi:MAG: sigma-70 family RNA polymerase sigma factor [Polyangiaceae bacterium]